MLYQVCFCNAFQQKSAPTSDCVSLNHVMEIPQSLILQGQKAVICCILWVFTNYLRAWSANDLRPEENVSLYFFKSVGYFLQRTLTS